MTTTQAQTWRTENKECENHVTHEGLLFRRVILLAIGRSNLNLRDPLQSGKEHRL